MTERSLGNDGGPSCSAQAAHWLERVVINLPSLPTQIETRSARQFVDYRKQVYQFIQQANAGVHASGAVAYGGN